MFKTNIRNKIFLHFPNFATFEELHDEEIEIYFDHLTGLYDDIKIRFKNLLEMEIPNWVVDPFEINVADINIVFQETLIELQSSHSARARFKHRF